LKLFTGAGEQTVVGVDPESRRVFVDRTHSGNVNFHPKFSGVYEAPLVIDNHQAKLHVFVDACSIEVFVNEGERVFTSLVFPSPDSRGVEFFGPQTEAKVHALNVWRLASIWSSVQRQ